MIADKWVADRLLERYPGRYPTLDEYEYSPTFKHEPEWYLNIPDGYHVIPHLADTDFAHDLSDLIAWCLETFAKDHDK